MEAEKRCEEMYGRVAALQKEGMALGVAQGTIVIGYVAYLFAKVEELETRLTVLEENERKGS